MSRAAGARVRLAVAGSVACVSGGGDPGGGVCVDPRPGGLGGAVVSVIVVVDDEDNVPATAARFRARAELRREPGDMWMR